MAQAVRQYTHSIPVADPKVPLIRIDSDGIVSFTNDLNNKLDMLLDAESGDQFLCAWPGQYRTDVFAINRREALKVLARG